MSFEDLTSRAVEFVVVLFNSQELALVTANNNPLLFFRLNL